MSEFKREERYIVVKIKHIGNPELERKLRHMISHEIKAPTVECVIVESDWPIYEEVWDMVQRLAEGRAQKIEQLQQQNANLTEEVENYRSTLGDGANLICESLGLDPEFYDRDQSDYACYSDMFEDVAKVILQSGIKWDGDDGEFKEKESD